MHHFMINGGLQGILGYILGKAINASIVVNDSLIKATAPTIFVFIQERNHINVTIAIKASIKRQLRSDTFVFTPAKSHINANIVVKDFLIKVAAPGTFASIQVKNHLNVTNVREDTHDHGVLKNIKLNVQNDCDYIFIQFICLQL